VLSNVCTLYIALKDIQKNNITHKFNFLPHVDVQRDITKISLHAFIYM